MTQQTDLYNAIIDSAVSLASRSSWEALRLYDVATDLGIPLVDIYPYFAEKEQVSEAWFERADRHMLSATQSSIFHTLSNQQKFHNLMMTWLDSLAINQKVTRQMILNKLEPGHLHIQLPALFRISRTVQWLREASNQRSTLPRRAFDETVLTSIYLLTFSCWLTDKSPLFNQTKRCLDRQLTVATKLGFLK